MFFRVQMIRDGLFDVELIGLNMTIRCRTRNFTSFNPAKRCGSVLKAPC